MASRKCPACGLVNPASAERCDCGRSFVDGSMGKPLVLPESYEARVENARVRSVAYVVPLVGLAMVGMAVRGLVEGYTDFAPMTIVGVLGLVVIVAGFLLMRRR